MTLPGSGSYAPTTTKVFRIDSAASSTNFRDFFFPEVLTHLGPHITQQAGIIPGASSLHQSQDLPLPRLKGHLNINFSS